MKSLRNKIHQLMMQQLLENNQNQRYSLYLDDERMPKTNKNWVIVRSYNEFVECILKNGLPGYISFDNDLGTELEGYDCAKWLVDQRYDTRDIEINVHSANPKAPDNIYILISNWNKMIDKFGLDYKADIEFDEEKNENIDPISSG